MSAVTEIEGKTRYVRKRLMMLPEEVLTLNKSGINIGAHTQGHPILTKINIERAVNEISNSKNILESLLEKEVNLFAYPNGRVNYDYNDSHVNIVKKLGFKAAVSTNQAVANRYSPVFELPRFTPWDKTDSKFLLRCLSMALKSRL